MIGKFQSNKRESQASKEELVNILQYLEERASNTLGMTLTEVISRCPGYCPSL